jgi:GR25 family glycosyltransferase involved in LPS biosynthesis
MQATWNGIDKIYCISLTSRPDRQAEARVQFARVGLTERVEFHIVEKHPEDCEQGIYESHLQCIRKGLEAGAERILIFEDDILFDRVSPERIARITAFLDAHQSWHMLLLGGLISRSSPTNHPSIRRVRYRSLTHGYVIHRRLAEQIVRQPWRNVPYDDFLKLLEDDETYALYPSIAFQSDSTSDNERYLPLDRFRRWCGGLRKIQRRNEYYHRHRRLIIGAHVAVLLLVLLGAIL